MTDPLTPFDAIALILIALSLLMGFARGFIREIATLLAFIAASAAAYLVFTSLGDRLLPLLPAGTTEFAANSVAAVLAFLLTYILFAVAAGRLARLIQAGEKVSFADRMVGLAYGVFRGVAAGVLFVYFIGALVPSGNLPEWVVNGATYDLFVAGADWVAGVMPDGGAPPAAPSGGAA